MRRYMHVRTVDLVRTLHAMAFWKSLPAPQFGSPRRVITAAELAELASTESLGSAALVALLEPPQPMGGEKQGK